jgi:hypothetical protein
MGRIAVWMTDLETLKKLLCLVKETSRTVILIN